MSDMMTLIQTRRSIRKFQDRLVPEPMLHKVLEAVRWAPSWANTQCWEVIVVQDPAAKEKLQASLPPQGNPAHGAMVQAPVVLVLCGKTKSAGYYKDIPATKFGDWMMHDLGIASQNICLLAHSLGLATVVVGLFDHNKAAEAMQVPAGYELVTMIPLGFPAKSSSAPKRREIAEFVHYDHW